MSAPPVTTDECCDRPGDVSAGANLLQTDGTCEHECHALARREQVRELERLQREQPNPAKVLQEFLTGAVQAGQQGRPFNLRVVVEIQTSHPREVLEALESAATRVGLQVLESAATRDAAKSRPAEAAPRSASSQADGGD